MWKYPFPTVFSGNTIYNKKTHRFLCETTQPPVSVTLPSTSLKGLARLNSHQVPLPKCKSVINTSKSRQLDFNNLHQYKHGKYFLECAMTHKSSHHLLSCLHQCALSHCYHWPAGVNDDITAAEYSNQCSIPGPKNAPLEWVWLSNKTSWQRWLSVSQNFAFCFKLLFFR